MAIKLSTYNDPGSALIEKIITRPSIQAGELKQVIDGVFDKIQEEGDAALVAYTKQFDGVELSSLRATQEEIQQGIESLDEELKAAIDVAYNNITAFHESQKLTPRKIETTAGVECWQEMRAIDKVGLYIPGGTAPLFSTVLMLGVPAKVAQCGEVVLCTPPQKDGSIHPAILYAARRCNISTIVKVGGSQAVAAMVFGTDAVPAVYKIFGPGNQYVTAAKMKALEYNVAIDLPAGPSEMLQYGDHSSDPAYIAADLLSQAEHGVDSQVVLTTTDIGLIPQVEVELEKQLATLPRKEIAIQALTHAFATVHKTPEAAFDFINQYAPEHFIISSDHAEDYLPLINNAGSVFVGHMTPESAGDYASGTNHTLPTSGYARSYSGLSLDSFVKRITFQKVTEQGLKDLGPTIVTMAENELLQGHANAVKVRLQNITNS